MNTVAKNSTRIFIKTWYILSENYAIVKKYHNEFHKTYSGIINNNVAVFENNGYTLRVNFTVSGDTARCVFNVDGLNYTSGVQSLPGIKSQIKVVCAIKKAIHIFMGVDYEPSIALISHAD